MDRYVYFSAPAMSLILAHTHTRAHARIYSHARPRNKKRSPKRWEDSFSRPCFLPSPLLRARRSPENTALWSHTVRGMACNRSQRIFCHASNEHAGSCSYPSAYRERHEGGRPDGLRDQCNAPRVLMRQDNLSLSQTPSNHSLLSRPCGRKKLESIGVKTRASETHHCIWHQVRCWFRSQTVAQQGKI